MKPGIYEHMSNSEYHGFKEWFSSTDLKTVGGRDGLLKWANRQENEQNEPSVALRFGSAAHSLILEGRPPLVAPFKDFRTSEAKKWKKNNSDEIWVTSKEKETLDHMAQAVRANSDVAQLLSNKNKQVETSFFWVNSAGYKCRCRPDVLIVDPENDLAPPIILDFKTTQAAGPIEFGREIVKRGYDQQAAFYVEGIHHFYPTRPTPRFGFIAQEKTAPYMTCLHFLSDQQIQAATLLNEAALEDLQAVSSLHFELGTVWALFGNSDPVPLPKWASHNQTTITDTGTQAPF